MGWEGFFGFGMTVTILFVLYFIPGQDAGSLENAPYAIAQMTHSWKLAAACASGVAAIALFNYFGVTITKRISSITRTTIATARTFFIWIISLIMKTEEFNWLQVSNKYTKNNSNDYFSVLVL